MTKQQGTPMYQLRPANDLAKQMKKLCKKLCATPTKTNLSNWIRKTLLRVLREKSTSEASTGSIKLNKNSVWASVRVVELWTVRGGSIYV